MSKQEKLLGKFLVTPIKRDLNFRELKTLLESLGYLEREDMLHHKEYKGIVEYSAEDHVYWGKLEGTKDIENAISDKVFFLFAPKNLTIVEKSC
jgi:hypothetical protein